MSIRVWHPRIVTRSLALIDDLAVGLGASDWMTWKDVAFMFVVDTLSELMIHSDFDCMING